MRVVQVGMGGMGDAWLKTVQASTEVDYAGFVEVDVSMAQRQAEAYGLDRSSIFSSLEQALAAVKADGLINVTPPQFHKEISIAALRAGVPVLSEKPLANSMEAARDILRASDETGVLHMVAQNYRYHAVCQTVFHALHDRDLGSIAAVQVEFFRGPNFGGFREVMDYPLILDMSIHHFDLLRFFLQSDPVAVFGKSWNPPWSWFKGDVSASLTIAFPNNVAVSYNGSWCSLGRQTSWNADWRFECERGVLRMQNDQVTIERVGQNDEPMPMLDPPLVAQAYLLHEFYQAIKLGKAPVTTCQDNIKSLGIVFDSIRSFETGGVVASS